ncbi:hypothetical protein ABPG72_005183 [Tetrahymena utriculariae]
MAKFIIFFSVVISLVLAQNPFIYQSPNGAIPTNSGSSQDIDLINYDSANCVCDITYLKDYDCSCDVDTFTTQTDYFTTKRKTTMEQSYMLVEYPLCNQLRNDINQIIPSYINNIACLARQNKPYSGFFYNSQEPSTSASSTATSTSTDVDQNLIIMTKIGSAKSSGSLNFVNYNVTDFLLFYQNTAQMDSNPNQLSQTQLKYASDFFGFCKLVPVIKRDIVPYQAYCLNQVAQNPNFNTIQLTSGSNGYSPTAIQAQTTYNLNIQIPTTSLTAASTNDQGYFYGNNLLIVSPQGLQNQIKFGGIYYLNVAQFQFQTLKYDTTPTNLYCTGIQLGDTTKQYIIYFTDIGSKANTAFQIIECVATSIITQSQVQGQNILLSFQYLSYSQIISEQSYTDRLATYVYKLFYPLYQFLSGSQLVFSLATSLGLLSILLL